MKDHETKLPRIVNDSALRDGVIGLAIVVVASGVAIVFDLAETWIKFAREYEKYRLEELPIFMTVLAVVLAWYSFRRWRETIMTSTVRHRLNAHLGVLLSRESLRNRQFREIKEMDERLLTAEDSRQACGAAVSHLRRIFPFGTGAFFVVRKGLESLAPIGGWGVFADAAPGEFDAIECRALISGGYRNGGGKGADSCQGCRMAGGDGVVCVPVTGQGKTFGVLQLLYGGPFGDLPPALKSKSEFEQMCNLADVVCRGIGQHLTNISLRRRLYDESWRDPLTGLLNRRGLEKISASEMGRMAAGGETMAVLMMDVDGFKGVNDSFGHEVGDFVLEFIGRTIKEQCRSRDIICRLGGDEFLVALPSAGIEIARKRADGIRVGVAKLAESRKDLTALAVTLSVGVAMFPEDGGDWDAVVAAADVALYAAKEAGKDRIAIGPEQIRMPI